MGTRTSAGTANTDAEANASTPSRTSASDLHRFLVAMMDTARPNTQPAWKKPALRTLSRTVVIPNPMNPRGAGLAVFSVFSVFSIVVSFVKAITAKQAALSDVLAAKSTVFRISGADFARRF